MHTVKSRESIRDAYFKYNVKSFSLDTKEELIKIIESTKQAKDLELYIRIAVFNESTLAEGTIIIEYKFKNEKPSTTSSSTCLESGSRGI